MAEPRSRRDDVGAVIEIVRQAGDRPLRAGEVRYIVGFLQELPEIMDRSVHDGRLHLMRKTISAEIDSAVDMLSHARTDMSRQLDALATRLHRLNAWVALVLLLIAVTVSVLLVAFGLKYAFAGSDDCTDRLPQDAAQKAGLASAVTIGGRHGAVVSARREEGDAEGDFILV